MGGNYFRKNRQKKSRKGTPKKAHALLINSVQSRDISNVLAACK